MINLLKDILNLNNLVKAFKNPKKFIKVFNDRINYYPGLKFGYTKSKKIKQLYMYLNIFFAKKNKNFKEFFFDIESSNSAFNTNFNLNRGHNVSEEHFQSLKQNGILILENALKEFEQNKISKTFDKFKDDLKNGEFDDYKDQDFTTTKDSTHSSLYTTNSELNPDSNLKKINDQITKRIYGKTIKPSQTFGYQKVINLPEKNIEGDNVWHSDRYLPNLKILYFPFGVDKDGAPFRYSLGTHKINKDYLNFFINKSGGSIVNSNEEEKFLKNTLECIIPPNTLVVTLTNGFHSRTPFKKETDRCALYLMYSNFKLSSLIGYWKYN